MKNQKCIKGTKILGILLLISLFMFLTATSASAATASSDYQKGYNLGVQAGYKVGYKDGNNDCLEHGKNGVLKQIPSPAISRSWNKNFIKGYKAGFSVLILLSVLDGLTVGLIYKNALELKDLTVTLK